MRVTLKIWRQPNAAADGQMHTYEVDDVSADMSFLEMLDVLNERLNSEGEEPIAFDSDCREGICGMCGLMISGQAHGPEVTTTCQLHMRSFRDGEEITVEPWRASAFPDGAIGAARFLFELMARRGIALRPGQWISSGAVTGVHDARPGQRVEARFGEGYQVECTLRAARPEG